jgi:hypothetical protein
MQVPVIGPGEGECVGHWHDFGIHPACDAGAPCRPCMTPCYVEARG